MMKNTFDVVLLTALPASGKSEIRNFLAHIEPQRLMKEFHIGDNLQLDDFPYVNFMRRIDEEISLLSEERIFYPTNENPFFDGRDWGTLTALLSEDYHDLLNRTKVEADSPAEYLFERIDRAALTVGIRPRMALLKEEVRKALAKALDAEAQQLTDLKQKQYTDDLQGKDDRNRVRQRRAGRKQHAADRDGGLPVLFQQSGAGSSGPCSLPLYQGDAGGEQAQEFCQGKPGRSLIQSVPRDASSGHDAGLRMRRYGISLQPGQKEEYRDRERPWEDLGSSGRNL